jgi:redox-regulated HSP33 family molecular chaperone
VALVVVGCGGHDREWDSAQLNKAVMGFVARTWTDHLSVTCPPGASLRAGGKVACTVRGEDPLTAVIVTADSSDRLRFTAIFHG